MNNKKVEKILQTSRSVAKSCGHRHPQVKKVICFEDHGQDFLEWGIDADGNVMTCMPYQWWVWKNAKVMMDTLQVGKQLCYLNKKSRRFASIKYPVERIEEVL